MEFKENEIEFKENVGYTKALNENGEGAAVIATLDVVDKDNDVTRPGAFGNQVVFKVPVHDWKMVPIGKARIEEVADEAIAHFKLNLKTTLGREWYEHLKFDMENPPAKQQYSYGFSIPDGGSEDGEFDGKMVRFLKKLVVHEVSPVLLGAGVGTRTLAIKSGQKGRRLSNLLNTLIDEHSERSGKPRSEIITEIALRAGMSPNAVRAAVRGDVDGPSERALGAFAFVLGVTVDRFTRAVEADAPKDADEGSIGRKGEQNLGEDKRATPRHRTGTSDRVWDAAANERRVEAGEGLRRLGPVIYAWRDPDEDPETKQAWRFIHHFVSADGTPRTASTRASTTGIAVLNGARGGTTIPDADKRGVWRHLAGHLEDADIEPPELRSYDPDSVKLADQILWATWDAEAIIERVADLREMRAKEGRDMSKKRMEQVGELQHILKKLDEILRAPMPDAKGMRTVEEYLKLRRRALDMAERS
ncbi:MAG: HK97 family phage prohead protease [Candidatus Binatia bacterium]